MHDWIRFWRVTLLWTAGAVTLVFVQFWISDAPARTGLKLGVLVLLTSTPEVLGYVLPVAVYAGGLAVGCTPDEAITSRRWHRHLLIALTAGAVVFVLHAYVAPWVYHSVLRFSSESLDHLRPAVLTRAELHATYLQHVADARADPQFGQFGFSGPWSTANHYGFQYHVQGALALLAVASAWLGMEAGRWTRRASGRATQIAQRWGPGLALVLWTAVALELGHQIATHARVQPFMIAYRILVPPALAIFVLAWARWTLNSSHAQSADIRGIVTT